MQTAREFTVTVPRSTRRPAKLRRYVYYEIRELDDYGDAIDTCDLEEGHGAKHRIMATASRMEADPSLYPVTPAGEGNACAYVVERVVETAYVSPDNPGDGELQDRDYTTVHAWGDAAALKRGGWID